MALKQYNKQIFIDNNIFFYIMYINFKCFRSLNMVKTKKESAEA